MDKTRIEIYNLQAEICHCLADPKRLMILGILKEGEMSVGELARTLECSQANVSQHLAILRNRGIVQARREGVTVFYSLQSPKISEACNLVHSFLIERLGKGSVFAAASTKVQ